MKSYTSLNSHESVVKSYMSEFIHESLVKSNLNFLRDLESCKILFQSFCEILHEFLVRSYTSLVRFIHLARCYGDWYGVSAEIL